MFSGLQSRLRMEPTHKARLPGPLAWPQTGKGKGPGSDFSSSLIYKKKEKWKSKNQSKAHSPGTWLYFQTSSQQEGMWTRAEGVTSDYRAISTYELAKGQLASRRVLLGAQHFCPPRAAASIG